MVGTVSTEAFFRPGIASAGGYLSRKDSLEKYRRCGSRALLLFVLLLFFVAGVVVVVDVVVVAVVVVVIVVIVVGAVAPISVAEAVALIRN